VKKLDLKTSVSTSATPEPVHPTFGKHANKSPYKSRLKLESSKLKLSRKDCGY